MAGLSGGELIEASSLGSDESGLPGDLAAAVGAALRGDPAVSGLATGGVYNGAAGDAANVATGPYLVFRIPSAPATLVTSDSYWDDASIRVEVFSSSSALANAVIEAVVAEGGPLTGVSLSYRSGATTTLVPRNRSQGPLKGRAAGSARVHSSSVEFQARARLGRPPGS